MAFIATRATSYTWAYATVVGSANTTDVQSSAPDTTTCASFTANSGTAGNDRIVWRAWETGKDFTSNSWYDIVLRIDACSMGTEYLSFDFSTNSGQSWSTFISSYGQTARSAVTLTRSIAGTTMPSSLLIRMNQTNAHTRARVQIYDLTLVFSYNAFSNVVADNVGLTDYTSSSLYTVATTYMQYPAEPVGTTDSALTRASFRNITSESVGLTDSALRRATFKLFISEG